MNWLVIVYGVIAITVGVIDRSMNRVPCPACAANDEHADLHGWRWTFALALLWPLCIVLLVLGVGRPDVKP